MISFDLKCDGHHVFEIWFRSSEDYERQRAARLIICPVCGDQTVSKAVMAPAVSAKGNRGQGMLPHSSEQLMASASAGEPSEKIKALLQALAEEQAKALQDSRWVGGAFVEQARAMHYGEADAALIHGTASVQDARAMLEEGVAVAPLLVPIAPPDQTN